MPEVRKIRVCYYVAGSMANYNAFYFDDEKKLRYVPYVIEPSLGADRVTLALLCAAYDEEELEGNDTRTVLHFHPAIAPVKIGVLPLSKKLNDGATKVFEEVSKSTVAPKPSRR